MAPPIDYSQPLNTSAPPPEPTVADPAMQTFDAARAAFKAGNYAEALRKTDQALKALPNDAAINEFRALCLFALKQYDQAAGTLYAVLSAGPGWDWTTLSDFTRAWTSTRTRCTLWRNTAPSTRNQPGPVRPGVPLPHSGPHRGRRRGAEGGREASARRSALGAAGHAALRRQGGGSPACRHPARPGSRGRSRRQGNLVGAWKASPAMGTTIELTLGGDSKFKWNIVSQGKTQPIAGTYTYENGI